MVQAINARRDEAESEARRVRQISKRHVTATAPGREAGSVHGVCCVCTMCVRGCQVRVREGKRVCVCVYTLDRMLRGGDVASMDEPGQSVFSMKAGA